MCHINVGKEYTVDFDLFKLYGIGHCAVELVNLNHAKWCLFIGVSPIIQCQMLHIHWSLPKDFVSL